MSKPNLISIQILHRHGSRGPGESELSPWSAQNALVKSQWHENDLENITSTGHQQCYELGRWFRDSLKRNVLRRREKILWRCSKSGRAKESGYDFIHGFNKDCEEDELAPLFPLPFQENADNVFRAWKTIPGFGDCLKSRMANDLKWAKKAEENEAFLKKIFSEAGAPKTTDKLTKALWSTTYLYCLRECEFYWPIPAERHALLDAIRDENDWGKITKLACWVWEERFIRSGFVYRMGGKIVREMILQSLNPDYNINIYSGHDYTILAVIALLGLTEISIPASFGCYVLLELWDDTPPDHTTNAPHVIHNFAEQISGKSPIPNSNYTERNNGSDDKRTFRVIFNPTPFPPTESGDNIHVHKENEVVLGQCSVNDMLELVARINSESEGSGGGSGGGNTETTTVTNSATIDFSTITTTLNSTSNMLNSISGRGFDITPDFLS